MTITPHPSLLLFTTRHLSYASERKSQQFEERPAGSIFTLDRRSGAAFFLVFFFFYAQPAPPRANWRNTTLVFASQRARHSHGAAQNTQHRILTSPGRSLFFFKPGLKSSGGRIGEVRKKNYARAFSLFCQLFFNFLLPVSNIDFEERPH